MRETITEVSQNACQSSMFLKWVGREIRAELYRGLDGTEDVSAEAGAAHEVIHSRLIHSRDDT